MMILAVAQGNEQSGSGMSRRLDLIRILSKHGTYYITYTIAAPSQQCCGACVQCMLHAYMYSVCCMRKITCMAYCLICGSVLVLVITAHAKHASAYHSLTTQAD